MSASIPQASLLGIPAELRNIIYEHLAADIDEVSIIGRKIGKIEFHFSDDECEDRMWHATAKHPLAQTCRKIRNEFSPIHRRKVIIEGVQKFYLELENYDVDCMGNYADLVNRVAPMLEHLRTRLTAEKFIIRFLLNGHALKSLPGLPPELRNMIYHMVATEIGRVDFIGRKIEQTDSDAEDRLWDTVAKHPLSQTSRELRQEFDPVHRHQALTVGVPRYRIVLENYDMDRVADFARLFKLAPTVLRHLRSCVASHVQKETLHFRLSKNFRSSVRKLEQQLSDRESLHRKFSLFSDLFENNFTRPSDLAKVVLNVRNMTMSAAEKRVAISGQQEMAFMNIIRDLELRRTGGQGYQSDRSTVMRTLYYIQEVAHMQHLAAKNRSLRARKDQLKAELKAEREAKK